MLKAVKRATKEVKTAAIYLRVSTQEQVEGYGLDAQRSKCEAMATVRGLDVIETYSDEGISGTKDATDRAGLDALLNSAAAGQFDAVIISALDRLGRKTQLVLQLVDQLTANGVSIISCKEALDTSTPSGVFVLSMFASLAQLERDVITERTTGGRNERGKIDGEKGGRVPMGYTRGDEGISIDEHTAKVVRFIFEKRAEGQTLAAITTELNAQNITTARGKGWHASSVREVLLNEAAYRGGPRNDSPLNWPIILQPTTKRRGAKRSRK
jgi:site-specific DNA recombinase